ncbi:DUF4811 domain-containing protein [Enterococcus canintestini]|uniref:DUF4811 domain-containing protein n=1 Tax=Enterococcus canintestini TaxID=317010 RepID=UPI00288DDEC1|nr:DUF4811 domain-containing protein [Enterococcus canintestini]MDT2738835.1 DUF4811 domain-containing protein [Enterococcus canintestini]
MIILIIIVALILVFSSWMLTKKTLQRWIFGILSLLLLGGSVFFFTDHVLHHTGMKIQTKTSTKPIYTAGNTELAYGVLVYQEIGTDSGNYVLVYRDEKSDGKPKAHYTPDFNQPAAVLKKSATYKYTKNDRATVTTITKRYHWNSHWAKLLYGFYGEEGQLVSQKSTVSVPKETWLIVTQKQSQQIKSLDEKMKQQSVEKKNGKTQNKQLTELEKTKGQQVPTKQIVNKLRTLLKKVN